MGCLDTEVVFVTASWPKDVSNDGGISGELSSEVGDNKHSSKISAASRSKASTSSLGNPMPRNALPQTPPIPPKNSC